MSNDQMNYGPAPTWIAPPPAPTTSAAAGDVPFRFIYSDQQVRVGAAGQEKYGGFRVRILKPEALAIGNVRLTWNPSAGSATVHYLRIIRDQKVIDVLKTQRFKVIQRENGLEQSMLDGLLTAVLQASDLRVGDELEFAATILDRDPTLGDHAYGMAELPRPSLSGAFRYTVSWPNMKKVGWQATKDLPQAVPTKNGDRTAISYELRDPSGVIVNEGAPSRYNVRRLIEFSDFGTWGDVSGRMAALFDAASQLTPTSSLKGEAARIAAASTDPVERTQAALRLVQDQIRYVYVGLDGGNYRPSSADLTWHRRFGDCKAKTAVLIALLRYLGIDAEPVLVSSFGGDGLNLRLPSPAVFNHVLVRARIDGRSYWLDGTRMGDRYLDRLPPSTFRWVLPVQSKAAALEEVPAQAAGRPQSIEVVEIDSRRGFDQLALVKARYIFNDDSAFAVRSNFSMLGQEDVDRALRTYWRQQIDWVEADRVSWQYDERRKTAIVTMEGKGKPAWDGDDDEGRDLYIVSAGFFAPDLHRRPKEQDQSAPWTTSFPHFKCYATTILLPPENSKWRWGYRARPMDLHLDGTAYWRASGLKDGVMRTVMSRRVEKPEITAAEAAAVNEAIASFYDKKSRVYQISAQSSSANNAAKDRLPFDDKVDWQTDNSACSAPQAKAVPTAP